MRYVSVGAIAELAAGPTTILLYYTALLLHYCGGVGVGVGLGVGVGVGVNAELEAGTGRAF